VIHPTPSTKTHAFEAVIRRLQAGRRALVGISKPNIERIRKASASGPQWAPPRLGGGSFRVWPADRLISFLPQFQRWPPTAPGKLRARGNTVCWCAMPGVISRPRAQALRIPPWVRPKQKNKTGLPRGMAMKQYPRSFHRSRRQLSWRSLPMNRSTARGKLRFPARGVRGVERKLKRTAATACHGHQSGWLGKPLFLAANRASEKSRSKFILEERFRSARHSSSPKILRLAPIFPGPTNCFLPQTQGPVSWNRFMREGAVDLAFQPRFIGRPRHRTSSSPPIWVCAGLRVTPPTERGAEGTWARRSFRSPYGRRGRAHVQSAARKERTGAAAKAAFTEGARAAIFHRVIGSSDLQIPLQTSCAHGNRYFARCQS